MASQNKNYQPPAWHRGYNSNPEDERRKKLGDMVMAMEGLYRGGGLMEYGANLEELAEKDHRGDGRCFHGYPIPPFR